MERWAIYLGEQLNAASDAIAWGSELKLPDDNCRRELRSL